MWDFTSRTFVACLQVIIIRFIIFKIKGHKEAVTCLALDSNILFSGSDDMNIIVWDAHSFLMLYTLTGHTGSIYIFFAFLTDFFSFARCYDY